MARVAALLLLAAALAPTAAQLPGQKPCVHGKPGWLADGALRDGAMARAAAPPAAPSKWRLDLDLPPEERWLEIAAHFAPKAYIIHDYLASSLNHLAWAMPLIEDVAAKLDAYKGFGDYAGEMRGLAKGLNLSLGDVVAGNLVYQLEGLGVNCSNWNNTGPTGQCANRTGVLSAEELERGLPPREDGPGACTSIIAQTASGQVYHARNLDWNLPKQVRQFVLDVEFHRSGGETVFVGTTLLGYTGLVTGLKRGGFTYSNDARCQGGKLLDNMLAMLLTGAQTPGQHARRVFEQAPDYASAIAMFEKTDLVDEVYYIVGGAKAGEGAVVTRDRIGTANVWRLEPKQSFFLLETNYDHWESPPSSDDRRTPGESHMRELGSDGITVDGLLHVMTQWPTFNHHTDYTAIMSAQDGTNIGHVWMNTTGGGGGGGGGR